MLEKFDGHRYKHKSLLQKDEHYHKRINAAIPGGCEPIPDNQKLKTVEKII